MVRIISVKCSGECWTIWQVIYVQYTRKWP